MPHIPDTQIVHNLIRLASNRSALTLDPSTWISNLSRLLFDSKILFHNLHPTPPSPTLQSISQLITRMSSQFDPLRPNPSQAQALAAIQKALPSLSTSLKRAYILLPKIPVEIRPNIKNRLDSIQKALSAPLPSPTS